MPLSTKESTTETKAMRLTICSWCHDRVRENDSVNWRGATFDEALAAKEAKVYGFPWEQDLCDRCAKKLDHEVRRSSHLVAVGALVLAFVLAFVTVPVVAQETPAISDDETITSHCTDRSLDFHIRGARFRLVACIDDDGTPDPIALYEEIRDIDGRLHWHKLEDLIVDRFILVSLLLAGES